MSHTVITNLCINKTVLKNLINTDYKIYSITQLHSTVKQSTDSIIYSTVQK